MTTEEEDYTVEAFEDCETDKNTLMGRFITMKEIREISDKRDFRVMFDVTKSNFRYRVGKQTNTTFLIGGIDDTFNSIPSLKEVTFESYLKTSTSWNLFQTLNTLCRNNTTVTGRSNSYLRIGDEQVISVFIQDMFDITKDLYSICVERYTQLPSSDFIERLRNSSLTLEDQFVYYVRYIYESLITTGDQRYYTLLENMFRGVPILKQFMEHLETSTFNNLNELREYYDTVPLCNRRECVHYTLKFHDKHLFDSYNLERYIKKFISIEGLDERNFDIIAKMIKSNRPERDLNIKVTLKKTIEYNPKQLKAFDLPLGLRKVTDITYDLKISNFLVDSKFEQCFKCIQRSSNVTGGPAGNNKDIEVDSFVQFDEAQELMEKAGLNKNEIHDYIELLSVGVTRYKQYDITGVIVEYKQLNKNRKAVLYRLRESNVRDKESNVKEAMCELEYKTTKQSSPRFLIVKRMAVLNIPSKNIDEFEKESLSGLYPHQIAFINASLDMVFNKTYSSVVSASVVGSGKTVGTVSLAYALKQIKERKVTTHNGLPINETSSTMVIYVTYSPGVLKEVFVKSKEIRLNVVSAFTNQNGHLCVKSASNFNDRNNIPFEKVIEHDILICHPLVLLKLFSVNSNEANDVVLKNSVIVIDELNSYGINSMPEHVTGSLLALLADKRSNLCVLSASVQKNKHINYLNRYGKVKLIESSNILVPTIVRGYNSKPLHLLGNKGIEKVLKNGFFRRFINPENIVLPPGYIQMMKERGVFDHAVMLELLFLYRRDTPVSSLNPSQITFSNVDSPSVTLETECIRKSCNYTLVATNEPSFTAIQIYGDIFRGTEVILTRYMRSIERLKNDMEEVELKLKDKTFRNNAVKERLREKVRGIEMRQQLQTGLRVDDEGNLLNSGGSFEGQVSKIRFMIKDSRFTSNEKVIFTSLVEYKELNERQEKLLDELLLSDRLNEKEKETVSFMKDQTLTQSEKLNLKLISESDKMLNDKESLVRQRDITCSSIRDEIQSLLESKGIKHKFPPNVTLDDILKWNKEKPQDYIWKVLGVFIETKKDTVAPQTSLNRLFAGVKFARGIDLAIEAIVITEGFASSVSSDDILQMTGRSGRPGKSRISIIYMSDTIYNKIYNAGSSVAVEQVIMRMNFYLQNQSQVDILEMPINDPEFARRLEILQESLKR